MRTKAGIAAGVGGLLALCAAQAESPARSRAVAGMYAEASRLAVTAEEAEQALQQPTGGLVAQREAAAQLESLVGGWASAAAGASVPAKAELRR